MRHRIHNEMVQLPNNVVHKLDSPCGVNTVYADRATCWAGSIRIMDDVVTPRWFRRPKNSFVFNPLFVLNEKSTHSGTGGVFQEHGAALCPGGGIPRESWDSQSILWDLCRPTRFGLNAQGSLNLGSLTAVKGEEVSSATRELSTRVQSKVKTGDTQGLESLAQLKQTIDLIRRPMKEASDLTSAFYKVMKGKGGVLRKGYEVSNELRKSVQSAWLKYRYGVLPLINDIKSVIKTLDSSHGVVLKSERARISLKGNGLTTATYGTGGWFWDIIQSANTEVIIRAVTVDSYETSIASDLGLTPDLIPQTLWELVPFSFVVDWFANVGDYLYAVIPRVGVDHKGGCITTEFRNVYQLTSGLISHLYPADIITAPAINYVQSSVVKTRTVGLNRPELVVKRDFRFDNAIRLADAAALIGVQLNKVLERFGKVL